MFSEEKAAYFSLALEEASPARNRAYAVQVLEGAAARCHEEDVRTGDLKAYVDWLAKDITRPVLARRFWEALSIADPEVREQAVGAALAALKRNVSGIAGGRSSCCYNAPSLLRCK